MVIKGLVLSTISIANIRVMSCLAYKRPAKLLLACLSKFLLLLGVLRWLDWYRGL